MTTVNGRIYAIAIQSDGKILIGGSIILVQNQTRNNIARLNTDGTIDLGFNPNIQPGAVYCIAVQPDGKILVGGQFTTVGGLTRKNIARLDAVTGAADSFNPDTDESVYSLAVQSDGKILAGGFFSRVGGQTRSKIARLDPMTGAADPFDPNVGGFSVYALALQPDGKILVGGNFETVGGETREGFARLDGTTGAPDSLSPGASNPGHVEAIAVQSDRLILVGGRFNTIGGQTRHGIARLDGTTGAADVFDPNPNSFGVISISMQADGKVLVGGAFSMIGGQPRLGIARLDPYSGMADSSRRTRTRISVDRATIGRQDCRRRLLRHYRRPAAQSPRPTDKRHRGIFTSHCLPNHHHTASRWSGPEFARVSFELSSDNGATYTFLGNATIQSSAYTLNGRNLPVNQDILIRGRGSYRSGYQNGWNQSRKWSKVFSSPTHRFRLHPLPQVHHHLRLLCRRRVQLRRQLPLPRRLHRRRRAHPPLRRPRRLQARAQLRHRHPLRLQRQRQRRPLHRLRYRPPWEISQHASALTVATTYSSEDSSLPARNRRG